MDLPASITIADGVLHHEVGAETVILNVKTERYYSVGGVAGRLWELFSADDNVERAIEAIVAEYDVDRATAERDLRAFIDRLADARLICAAG